jgi:hypothetical protein
MKTWPKLACLGALLLAGCGGDSQSPTQPTNAPSGGSPLTAPVDYLGAVGKAHQSAVKTADVTTLNQAINLFQVDKGRLPKDLNELVAEGFIPKIPDAPYGMKIVYDATKGSVRVVKQ